MVVKNRLPSLNNDDESSTYWRAPTSIAKTITTIMMTKLIEDLVVHDKWMLKKLLNCDETVPCDDEGDGSMTAAIMRNQA
jgi:hypothetical protein